MLLLIIFTITNDEDGASSFKVSSKSIELILIFSAMIRENPLYNRYNSGIHK